VLGDGLGPAVAGGVIGMAAAAASARLLRGLLFGVTPLDPVSVIAAPVVAVTLVAIACLVPARNAARVDPRETLRS
jgi:ABC-type lipoprotein release transport system permease subunit